MKAVAVFPERRRVDLIQVPEPDQLGADEVRFRVLDVGVCGTDREICAFEYGTPPRGSPHLIIGHECVGEVIGVGSSVVELERGDLVVPTVRRPCPHDRCAACRAGRQDFCFTGDFRERGIKEEHGFMTEVVVERKPYLNRVPAELREVAVLVEPLTIAEKALRQVWQLQARLPWSCERTAGGGEPGHCHRAVVLGAGPVGLLGAMTLKRAGFATYVYSRSPGPNAKAALVESIGATYVSSEECPVESLAEMVGNIDLVFEAVGASQVAFQVLHVLGVNGMFVFTGVPGRKAPITVDTDRLMRDLVLKNQLVLGTVNAGREAFADAIEDLGVFRRRWPKALAALITGRHAVEECRALLATADGIKNVITFA